MSVIHLSSIITVKNIVSKATGPILTKIHSKPSWAWGMKVFSNVFGLFTRWPPGQINFVEAKEKIKTFLEQVLQLSRNFADSIRMPAYSNLVKSWLFDGSCMHATNSGHKLGNKSCNGLCWNLHVKYEEQLLFEVT